MPKILKIPEQEFFVPPDQFLQLKETEIKIEHSLVAIAKWEQKWKVAFLDDKTIKTDEMMLDYIKCMTITQNVDPLVYLAIANSQELLREINEYIDDPMTATTFVDHGPKGGRGEFITNEIIYYWMIAQGVPIEFEKWHLNRLMTLIRVCSEKNSPSKKMSKRDILSRNRALNAQRRAKLGSKG